VFPGTGSAASEIASSSKAGHLGGLDGLRAIAALSVFGVHFNQMVELKTSIGPFDLARWLANGNTGVALFFVLSGFLLSLPFWRQGRAWGSRIDVKSYIFHRLIRVLPAYYLCLFGLLAIMLAKGRVPDLNNLLSHVVFLYNINDRNILSLNAPFWSLALEMQFYLLLPLLMLALTRLSAWAALGLLAVLSVGAYCANYGLISYLLERDQWPILMTLIWPFSLYISGPDSFVLTYSLLAHLTYFLIGIATALIFVMGEGADQLLTMRMKMSAADWLFWSCATAIFLILSTPLDDLLQAPHGHYNWPFVPFLLAVMIFVTPQARLAKVFLESRPLRWLGLISYGFYIFHYPILTFLARMFGQYGLSMTDFWWLFAILSLLASMAVAAASYWMFELPLMRWAQKVPIWQPGGRSVRAHSVERASVSLSPNKDVLAQQPTGNDWIRVKIHFRSSQLDVLKRLSDKLGVSLSAAARQVLEICIVDSGQYWASSKMTSENNQKVADAAGETYCVNMHYGQYEFLLEAADRIGRSIDEVFCLMIDHNSKTLLFSEQIGSTYDL
jgi:peptidoglycan/LPS O-acetylase OafA/YrhL